MRRSLRLLIIVICALASTAGAEPPGKAVGVKSNPTPRASGRRWAFMVGINDYVSQPKLKFCRQDCMALRTSLLERGRFDSENIVVLTDDAKRDLDRPTFGQIYSRLPPVLEAAELDDLVLVYLSGHGAQFDDANGRHAYFIPLDGSGRLTSIPLNWVTEQMEACKARQKVLILDACRNDVAESGKSTRAMEGSIVGESQGKSFVTLFSCDAGQRSAEHDRAANGVYTYYLLEGLAGAADKDGDGRVDLFEAHLYAREKTQVWGVQHGQSQSPMLKGEIGDPMVLAFVQRLEVKPATVAVQPVTTTRAAAPKPGELLPLEPVDPKTTPSHTASGTGSFQLSRGATKAKRVSINLGGQAIGSAPYYLSYSANLPASLLDGAEFLWMDNGVEMGTEPRDSKILTSPGLHRISVLVITKSNDEYRGAITVQILEKTNP